MATPRDSCHTLPQAPERRGPSLKGENSQADMAAKQAALQRAAILLIIPKMGTPTLPEFPAYTDQGLCCSQRSLDSKDWWGLGGVPELRHGGRTATFFCVCLSSISWDLIYSNLFVCRSSGRVCHSGIILIHCLFFPLSSHRHTEGTQDIAWMGNEEEKVVL